MNRNASAVWNGTIKEGKGIITTSSKILNETPYSFTSRFEGGNGTNPEELIAAAHAGCFTMKLSLNLTEAGFNPTELKTKCDITFQDLTITESKLVLNAKVPNIDKAKFDELVNEAKDNCPISKLLNTKIVLDYSLEN